MRQFPAIVLLFVLCIAFVSDIAQFIPAAPNIDFGPNTRAAMDRISKHARNIDFVLCLLGAFAFCAGLLSSRMVATLFTRFNRLAISLGLGACSVFLFFNSASIIETLLLAFLLPAFLVIVGRIFQGSPRLDRIAVLGSFTLLVPILGAFLFRENLGVPFMATHESEWLASIHRSCELAIHGWAVNCLPSYVLDHFGGDGFVIAYGRLFRFALGIVPFFFVAAVFWLASCVDHNVRSDRDAGWKRSDAFALACVCFVVLHGRLVSFGNPALSLGLAWVPVRDLSTILFTLVSLAIVADAGRWPGCGGEAMILRCIGYGVGFGIAIQIGFVFNILAPAQAVPYLVVCVAFLAVQMRAKGLAAAGLFLVSLLAGAGLGWLVLSTLTPAVWTTSVASLLFFVRDGSDIFADQYHHNISLFIRQPRTLISLFLLGLTMWVLVSETNRSGLAGTLREQVVLLIFASGVFINTFAITGYVISLFGATLLVSHCFVARYIRFNRSTFMPGLKLDSLGSRFAASGVALVLLICVLIIPLRSVSASVEGLLRTKDEAFVAPETLAFLQRASDRGCFFSLLSQSSIGVVAGKRLCSSALVPWYASRLSRQSELVAELSADPPSILHVASHQFEHGYLPNRHLSRIFAWAVLHYCPDRIVAGRWFWRPSEGAGCRMSPPHTSAADVVLQPTQVNVLVSFDSGLSGGGPIGIILQGAGSGSVLDVAVGQLQDGRVSFVIAPTIALTKEIIGVHLSRDGAEIIPSKSLRFVY